MELQSSSPSCVLAPEPGPVSNKSVINMVKKLLDVEYLPLVGVLKCGSLVSKIGVHPSPEPFSKVVLGETVTSTFSETLDVCGFINIGDLGSPMAVSRHLVTPLPNETNTEADVEDGDDGKVPSFCVLFHGALKVENVAAICTLGDNWFGLLYSWADNKKKSNLMLAVLEPGDNTVPWLGNLNYLGRKFYFLKIFFILIPYSHGRQSAAFIRTTIVSSPSIRKTQLLSKHLRLDSTSRLTKRHSKSSTPSAEITRKDPAVL